MRLSFQEKKRKIDFQDGGHGGYLGLRIGSILAIFALQNTPKLHTVSSQLAFWFGRKGEFDFQDSNHGGPLGYLIGMILTIF